MQAEGLSPEDLAIIAKAIRALERSKDSNKFGKVNGIDQLKSLVERFGEVIINDLIDALENLAKTKTVVFCGIGWIYTIGQPRFGENTGQYWAIKGYHRHLLAKPDDRDIVIASATWPRAVVERFLLPSVNVKWPNLGLFKHTPMTPEVLKHISDEIKALDDADHTTFDQFKKIGRRAEQNSQTRQYSSGKKEINDAQDRTKDVMAELAKLTGLLDDSEYASKYVQKGISKLHNHMSIT
ncbi:hypothetical protein RFI_30269 [Reticulomyxa filosa]|uniref:Uncharacterized protein n=1 Tax=Reticulomyxa filosa TaxID=46433 RepID=X6M2C1_RETFI|nr:hypothetical protein RFI_30269 [Reticulomyxa filosa]|eukprot:ETO07125.1 hypothetical protein RFI_30269 [Reticulomyxa filosa]